jgi:hypothetical protein
MKLNTTNGNEFLKGPDDEHSRIVDLLKDQNIGLNTKDLILFLLGFRIKEVIFLVG